MTLSSKKIWIALCVLIIIFSAILLTVSIKSIIRSKESIRQSKWMQEELLPLLDKSLQLGQLINAEMQVVNQEIALINAELAKPQDQRDAGLNFRLAQIKLRNEKIQKLLIEQQQINEQVEAMQENKSLSYEIESSESKAVQEKY